MLFVLLHEMAHVSITQMGLPVLGRTEDAADTYATLRLIRSGSNFSHRVLTEAAQGWFMADRRDQKAGDKVAYYDDHGRLWRRGSGRDAIGGRLKAKNYRRAGIQTVPSTHPEQTQA